MAGKDSKEGLPPCAVTCPRDKDPTCEQLKTEYFADDGCASTCSADIKGWAEEAFCEKGGEAPAPSRPLSFVQQPEKGDGTGDKFGVGAHMAKWGNGAHIEGNSCLDGRFPGGPGLGQIG